jgi:hypothetical protein
MRNLLITLMSAVLLAACGGEPGTSGSVDATAPMAQDKTLAHSQKAQASQYQDEVEGLYIAYFGRPADPVGLINFENALDNAGAPSDLSQLSAAAAGNPAIETRVASFANSAESQKLYGNGNAQDFVSAVFQNVVDRVPQTAGLTYWGSAISSGSLNRGDAALAILSGALANTSVQGEQDAKLVANRLAVAGDFTAQVELQDKTASYSGGSAAANARTELAAVTATTDVTAYEGEVQAYVAAMNTSASNVSTYSLQGVTVTGSTNGAVTGSFSYDWNSARVTTFSFTTPLGNFDSTQPGNVVTIAGGSGYTSVGFANNQATLTLYYPGTPGTNDIGFFSGAPCTTKNVCLANGATLPVSSLNSLVMSSNQVWVPDLVWVPNMVWVADMVWVSNWVWVSDMECSATDDDGNCTSYEDDGYYEDDGGYADQGGYVDEGSYVDEGGYVGRGGYPSDKLSGGLTVLIQ